MLAGEGGKLDAQCRGVVLEPGDALLLPQGWWHYACSLSVSFSVSFWWDERDSKRAE